MDIPMPIAYIALGSNLPSHAGPPAETLAAALMHLAALGQLVGRSSFYTTAPVGYADQPDFSNGAAALQTQLTPHALLEDLLEIERSFGRDRTGGITNGPRTLDLDLLLYDDYVMGTEKLRLPHPRMTRRGFVLIPLAEIAPELIHPVTRTSMTQLVLAAAQANEDPSPGISEEAFEDESDDAPEPVESLESLESVDSID